MIISALICHAGRAAITQFGRSVRKYDYSNLSLLQSVMTSSYTHLLQMPTSCVLVARTLT